MIQGVDLYLNRFKRNATSDWLKHLVQPVIICLTFISSFVNKDNTAFLGAIR